MIKLLKLLKRKEVIFLFFGACFIIFQIWFDLKMPEYMNTITQIAQGDKNPDKGAIYSIYDIGINGVYMIMCTLGSIFCSIVSSYIFVSVATNFAARLREQLYIKVQNFSVSEISEFSIASLITRSTNDVQQVQMLFTTGLQVVIKAPITAIWAITKIANKQWQWSVAIGIAVVIIVVIIIIITLLVMSKFKKIQMLTDKLNHVTRENLTGVRVIRAYNAEKFHENKFQQVNNELTRTNIFAGRTMSVLNPMLSFVLNFISLTIYWIGAIIISNITPVEAIGTFGDMIEFMFYGTQIISSFMLLTMIFMSAPPAFVSIRRIKEVLETKELLKDGKGVDGTTETGTVEFRNVSFRYPGSPSNVFSNISFKVKKGQKIAITGAIGCGKTTLVNLILRCFDATEGEVLVDNRNVKEYTKNQLVKKIGYVPQKSVLFSGDIYSNIDFGDNDSNKEMIENAINRSQSSDFVNSKEDGIYSRVEQDGANFSGGQKQRLSIARAFARGAEIYILDDSFSALDFQTDKQLRNIIKTEMNESTFFIVSQRIATIMDVDLILVLDDGILAGLGSHEELLITCPAYQRIAQSQLSEEELKNV